MKNKNEELRKRIEENFKSIYPTHKLMTMEVAKLLEISPSTLESWRGSGNLGPKFFKESGIVFYYLSDVYEFFARNTPFYTSTGRILYYSKFARIIRERDLLKRSEFLKKQILDSLTKKN